MTFKTVPLIEVECDNCKTLFEYEDGGGFTVWNTEAEALNAIVEWPEWYGDDGWTEDGHGKHHCGDCPRLTLDPAVKAEREAEIARKLTAADIPLEGLES